MSRKGRGMETVAGIQDIGNMALIPILASIRARVRTVLLHNRILIRAPETKRNHVEGGDRHQGPVHPATPLAVQRAGAAEGQ